MKPILLCLIAFFSGAVSGQTVMKSIPVPVLKDKIKGGWAGQTIGVTFGGPYEFRFSGSFIQDYQPLKWYDGYIKKSMIEIPGLYDDLYMDLTFVEVFEKYGLNAHVDSFANAFARAEYPLWHANQSARYNILQGLKAPATGNWLHNPHADDIDYQIEADFAGLMSPGMPNTASAISDKIGHIMNYGDGWYGGVYVGAMYTMAFFSTDIQYIVNQALKTIPKKTTYHQCISDVIAWHKKYPSDWHQTWLQLQKKWSSDRFCPDGVFAEFDIDATLNSAYVVLGLLYGNGDYGKTMEITTRAGQDADCNPSTAGGVLGVMLGYNKIPAYWKMGLKEAEDLDFKYTNMSLNKVYQTGYKHAIENISRNKGFIRNDSVFIQTETPRPVRWEQSFDNLYIVNDERPEKKSAQGCSFSFSGNAFVLKGSAVKKDKTLPDKTMQIVVSIDGLVTDTIHLPTSYLSRSNDIYWNYQLADKKHKVEFSVLNPEQGYALEAGNYLYYTLPKKK